VVQTFVLTEPDLDQNSNYDSLRGSDCTSCSIQADKSAYWTPTLYYEKANGSFVSVPDSGIIIYYLGRGVGNATAFPPGFRMLSGNPGLRSYNQAGQTYGTAQYPSRPIADRVSFNCINYNNPRPETSGFPSDFNCPQGFRAQIHFPTCWDGKNLYQRDQSHVAYLSDIDNGICPPTHPVLLPHLFYEIYFAIDQVDAADGGRFLLSTGDLTGYGFHGDFLNGWDPTVQEQAVAKCLADTGFGTIEECPTLLASNDNKSGARCPLQPPAVNELVTGVLPALPGCNPPTAGPAPVVQQLCPANFTGAGPRIMPSVGSTESLGNGTLATYKGCYADNVGGRAMIGAAYRSTTSMSTASCASFCQARGFNLAGTEFGVECYCANTISTTAGDNTQCSMLCSGDNTEYCGGPSRLSVWTLSAQSANATFPSTTSTTSARSTFATTISANSTALSTSTRSANVTSTVTSGSTSTTRSLTTITFASSISSSATATTSRLPTSATASSTALASSQTASVARPSSASYIGCYTDTRTSRTLGDFYQSTNQLTGDACAALARSQNLKYFGLEYGGECWAADTINPIATQASDSQCNTVCKGDSSSFCGGFGAISIFENAAYVSGSNTPTLQLTTLSTNGTALSATYAYDGCYTDAGGNRRTLAGYSFAADDMTVEKCATSCLQRGFALSGTEFGRECYCGQSVSDGSSKVDDSDCSQRCAGDSSAYCGAASRITVYKRQALSVRSSVRLARSRRAEEE
jgi:hypothetical protein